MRVQVDPTKCQGHGTCNDTCPSVFAVDEWGYAYTSDPQGNVPTADEADAREAVAGCPEQAITEI